MQSFAQKENHFEVSTLHNFYTRNIIESEDGHIWTVGKNQIIRQVNGAPELIPFLEKMKLDEWETDIRGNLYVRGTELFFPLKDKIHAYDYVAETSRVVWETPDGGNIGYFVNAQDDQGIWLINYRDNSNEVFYSNDGFSFGEAIYDMHSFLKGKVFTAEFGLRAHHGRLYIHPHYHGLLVIDKTGNEVDLPMPEARKKERSQYGIIWRLDNTGRLWRIGLDGGLYYDEPSESFLIHPSSKVLRDYMISGRFVKELPARISCILEDKQGRMWMPGPDNFLICIDHEKEELYDFQKDIQEGLNFQDSDPRRLLVDRNGNIWVILNGGTMFIKPKVALSDRYHYNSNDPSKPIYKEFIKNASDSLYQIIHSSSKNTLINNLKVNGDYIYYCHDRAIHRINPETRQHEMLPFVNTWIHDFLIYNNKLFTVDKSAVFIDLSSLEVTEVALPFLVLKMSVPYKTDQFICKAVINQDDDEALFLMNGSDWSVEKEITFSYQGKPYPQPYIAQMIMVKDSLLLLNDTKNIFHVNVDGEILQKMNVFKYENGDIAKLSTNKIHYIVRDLNGDLIVASNKDFIILDIDTWHVKAHLSFEGRMNDNYINRIIPVEDGYWITTFEQLLHYSKKDSVYTILNEEDGFKYREIRGDYVLPNGEIILGTSNGLSIFEHEKVLQYKNSPKDNIPLKLISYNYFSKNEDQKIHQKIGSNVAHEINLSHSDRQLELEVQLMDLAGAEDHYYSYKIDGYIDQWTDAVQNNKINLFGLQPGKYDIMVRASKSLGLWPNEALLIKLHVSQAWYKRWWSYLAYAILVFGAGYALYRYRLHQIRRYEKLRTRISSDLHDDVGTILSSVAMQSEFLSQDAPKDKVEWFEDLSNLSREAMSRMRDTVWAIDSRKDNMESLVDRMQDFLSDINQIEKFKIKFDHQISKRSEKLPPDIRQNVYLIFKEAVNNAFKYSTGNQLSIQLHRSPKEGLHLNILDNGKVDESNIKTSGTGLSNMKMRTERINGKLEILTNDGFEIDLQV